MFDRALKQGDSFGVDLSVVWEILLEVFLKPIKAHTQASLFVPVPDIKQGGVYEIYVLSFVAWHYCEWQKKELCIYFLLRKYTQSFCI